MIQIPLPLLRVHQSLRRRRFDEISPRRNPNLRPIRLDRQQTVDQRDDVVRTGFAIANPPPQFRQCRTAQIGISRNRIHPQPDRRFVPRRPLHIKRRRRREKDSQHPRRHHEPAGRHQRRYLPPIPNPNPVRRKRPRAAFAAAVVDADRRIQIKPALAADRMPVDPLAVFPDFPERDPRTQNKQ